MHLVLPQSGVSFRRLIRVDALSMAPLNYMKQETLLRVQANIKVTDCDETMANKTFDRREQPKDPREIMEWIKTIDIWDEKFDYVMHDDHWLTSKWSPDCEKCRAATQDLIDLNETFDLYRSALAITPKPTSKIPRIPSRLSRQFEQTAASQPNQ